MKIRIFTDGACSGNPGPGGWALVFNTDRDCQTLSGCELDTTNNRMELMAMLEALKRIVKDNNTTKNTYEIYSDSAYVVNSINNNWIAGWKIKGWKTKQGDPVKNTDIWKKVDKCLERINRKEIDVKIIKVKGHAGNTFNELVDSLAKQQSAKAIALLGK